MLPERIRALEVGIGEAAGAGQLLKTSTCEFRYLDPDPAQPAVALLMPASERLTWQDGGIAQALGEALRQARGDERMPVGLLEKMRSVWEDGLMLAR